MIIERRSIENLVRKRIAKISATENLGGALGYNFKKVEKGEANILLAAELYQSNDGNYTMEDVLTDMEALILKKGRTKKTVFHCSLNPHPDEKLSDEQFTQIVKEYMEALGYGKQPYIVFKHNDIAREHIHIVSLRVDSRGRKINDKFEKRRSKKITDALERKFGLIPSSKVTDKAMKEMPKIDTTQRNIKEQVSNVVRMVLKHYHFCSLGELNAILSAYNLTVEEVKTEFRGKKYDGQVYVPTDDKGNKVSTPIHASDIGRGVGYTAVQNRMQKSKRAIKPLIPAIRHRILKVMCSSPQTEKVLQQRLKEQGLRTVVRKNEGGRIYGITFIDDKEGVALNGSRLGKGYAANIFNGYSSNPAHNPFLDETLYGCPSIRLEQSATVQPSQQNTEENDNLIDELFEDMSDGLFLPTGNDDWKETAWQRKLRRQNKVNLRRRKR